jgi:hypothetical protein
LVIASAPTSITTAASTRLGIPNGAASWAAYVAPTTAPNDWPKATSGNSRSPSWRVYRSFANDQNCAMIMTANTDTHTKNTTPMSNPSTTIPARPTKLAANASVTRLISFRRGNRSASRPYSGTTPASTTTCSADVYAFTSAPDPARISPSRMLLRM